MKKSAKKGCKRVLISKIVARRRISPDGPHLARLHVGPLVIKAAIGKTGVSNRKREGDGASPAGCYLLKSALFRSDRLARPACLIGARSVQRTMGWCDDAASGRYNRPVPAGGKARHERLWRDDGVYDVVVATSHNQRPRILGAGSAIFLHVARPDYAPTEGCVAIALADLRRLLPRLSGSARLIIVPG